MYITGDEIQLAEGNGDVEEKIRENRRVHMSSPMWNPPADEFLIALVGSTHYNGPADIDMIDYDLTDDVWPGFYWDSDQTAYADGEF